MLDADSPVVGPPGDESEAPSEGALLFDPSTAVPVDEFAYDEPPPPPPRSKTPLVVGGLIGLGSVAVVAFVLLGGAGESSEGAELPALVDPLPPVATLAEALVAVPGENMNGPVNGEVILSVRASGRTGAAIADTLVRFQVTGGGGTIADTDVRTNRDGLATTALVLPSRPGPTTVLANVPGSSIESVSIVVEAVPGMPQSLEIVSGDMQQVEIGELLPTRVFVALMDASGNPVPNAQVRFEVTAGDGLTAPSETRTDSIGRASALWRLGLEEGEHRLRASSPLGELETFFTAIALPRVTPLYTDQTPLETGPVTVVPSRRTVGGSHACKLEGGVLQCRGGNERGQTGAQNRTGFIAIAAGASHTCGLDVDGVASCWGGNDGGQHGDGSRTDRPTAVAVRTELRFSALAAGSAHTCGLAGGGVPLCWGQNLSGQLGDGTRNDQTSPRTVGGGLSFRSLAAGWSHTCGLTHNGNAFCWGLNSQGQLGDGSTLDRVVPTLVRGAVESIVAGSAHTCGISQGQVLCWGGNSFGQLGNGTLDDSSQAVEVQGLPGQPTHLAAGAVHTCAIITGATVYCWGQNLQGQLGDGTTENRSQAVAVSGGLSFTEIHAGGASTCGVASDGVEYCWGLNQSGQLGDGTRVNRREPTRVN